MPIDSAWHRLVDEVVYRLRVALLTVFGPAQLDDEHDPIAQLRREHDRTRHPRNPGAMPRGGRR